MTKDSVVIVMVVAAAGLFVVMTTIYAPTPNTAPAKADPKAIKQPSLESERALYTGYCKVNGITNLTFEEWKALASVNMLPGQQQPKEQRDGVAEVARDAVNVYGAVEAAKLGTKVFEMLTR